MNLRSLLLATTASLSLASFAGCDDGGSGSGGSAGFAVLLLAGLGLLRRRAA